MLTNKEFVTKLKEIATNRNTLYVMGAFGAPLKGANVTRYCNNHSYNRQTKRTAKIKAAANKTPTVYAFDCSGLIKGVLWGWCGNDAKTYGGAAYTGNGVPDMNANKMINVCSDVSNNFSKIEVGELVWVEGHIGVYIGDGLAVECTPSWKDGVQITACNCAKSGYNRRNWTKHGKFPYINYVVEEPKKEEPKVEPTYKTYTVKKGDSLWKIAKTQLGSGLKYTQIKKLNGLKSNTIYTGQVLLLPK